MKKILLISFMLLSSLITQSWAQERTVSGKVTDAENGEGLPGVNVILKGTTTGTTTDIDGNYKLNVPSEGGTLTFSFIGLATQEVEIGSRSVIDLGMRADAKELEEVVVTAQGIQREARSLGYAISSVDGDDVASQSSGGDVARALGTKIPGLNVTSVSGTAGSGTNITIRGFSSISGSNQPLFIVDGVPFSTSTVGTGDAGANGFNNGDNSRSSRFLDLDPNNIESVNVLKGLSATVIYGEQGRNGVILITTKAGNAGSSNKGFEVTLNQSYFTETIASLPDYQDNYGGGFHQNFGFFFSNWGPNFNTIDSVNHPLSALQSAALIAAFPEFQCDPVTGVCPQYAYQAYNSVDNFFRDGHNQNTSVTISGGNETSSFTGTFGYSDIAGFTPGNDLEKINLSVGGNAKLANRLTLSSTFNFSLTDYATPPVAAGSGSGTSTANGATSVFQDVFYTPRSVDLTGLPYFSPVDFQSVYYRSGNDIQNPRWTAEFTGQKERVSRLYGKTALTYNITDDINLTYRVGLDTYSSFFEYFLNKGGVNTAVDQNGYYRTEYTTNTIWDHSLIFNLNKNLTSDLNFSAYIGANARQDRFDRDGQESQNQLVFGFIEHSNFVNHASINQFTGADIQRRVRENLNALYGQFTFDYKDFLYVNLSARNDWSSTVESENQSLFYPSASVSFIPTTALGIESDVLNYLKVRLGYGTSAGFPNPYNTRNIVSSSGRAFVDQTGTVVTSNSPATLVNDNGATSVLGNPNLKPELHKELELGLEAKLFRNKLGFDVTVYRKITNDLITNAPLDPSTGYTSTNINIGEVSNKGIEIGLDYTPVKFGDFSWNIKGNLFAYETVVEDLGTTLSQVVIAGFTNLGNFALEGQPFNIMQGSTIQTDADGQLVIDANGNYVQAPGIGIIGDPNPEFTSSLINTVSWKGLTLTAQVDYRQGGDIYSVTSRAMLARGLTTSTDFNRDGTFVLPGVKQSDGQPNDIQITATQAYFNNVGFGPSQVSVWDGTTVRLRDVTLAYQLPASLLENLPIGSVSLSISGQNLWFKAVNFPDDINFDSDVNGIGVGNGLGFDFLNGPSARRYGFTARITF